MITDRQTNTVYFSNTLPEEYPEESNELFLLLKKSGYEVKLLIGADDFFCRDFMPIQISDTDFVRFVFRPDSYLKGDEMSYLTDPFYVELMTPGLTKPKHSPIILDGGNVIKGNGKAIITERVLKDNRYQFESDQAIIDRLQFDLQAEIIIIPEFPNEATGHADGLIRFIDADTVFINKPDAKHAEWEESLREILTKNKLKYIELPCPINEAMDSAEGLYLNYLQVGNLLIIPQFCMDEDEKALSIISEALPDCKVIPFKANWIAKEGGIFNCMTWTIKE